MPNMMIDTAKFLRDERTALVVIDLQRGIVSRNVTPHSSREVVGNAAKLASAFRAAALPVIWVHVSYTVAQEDILKPLVDNPPQTATPAPGWDELVPELGVRDGDVVVTKRNWGAFYGTDLDLHLRRRGVTRIAICGISTNIGVESTARDAYERNYKMLFIEDAMAAMSDAEHEHSCQRLFPRMGIVRTTLEVLTALTA
jgi:nicotinamidase-related amidase